jgi:cytochrome c-type biogenesis protein CcmH
MTTFVILAALMAALAAAVVTVPLWRERQSRWVGAIAGVLVAAAAAGLYPLWSNWSWHSSGQTQPSGPDVAAMVAKLEAHMRDDPNDVRGWMMLGRSYIAMERLDDAILAYDHAHQLDAGNAEAALGLAEAMSLRAGGNITPAASLLFEQAVKLAPDNPKALLYGGFAAAERGDKLTARSRWLALKDMHPPAQIEQLLDARIAELGVPSGSAAAGSAVAGAPATIGGSGSTSGSTSTTGAAAAPQSSADATVNVTIALAPALKAKLTEEAPLFVFAREPGAQGPPLAAKRLTTAAIGTQIHLSAADSMMPGRVLISGQRVTITARVSFSGQPLPAAGDLYGEVTYDVGHDGPRDLIIDRVAQ